MSESNDVQPCQAPPSREELLDTIVFAGRKIRDGLNRLIDSSTDGHGNYATDADRQYCDAEASDLARIVGVLARSGRKLD